MWLSGSSAGFVPAWCNKLLALIIFGALLLVAKGVFANTQMLSAPGRLISIGTHSLHIQCGGEGSPTIILEAGLGGSALEWVNIQSKLSKQYRVCSYDRAGMGWSGAGPVPRASLQMTEELYQLLHKAEIPGPYLLVGHSLGGYNVQLFASRFPELTAGLVLIDSSHPEQIERFAADPVRVNIAPKGKLMHLVPVQVPANIPEQVRETAAALLGVYKSRIAVTLELQGFRLSAKQTAQADPLPDVPLLVISRGIQKWPRNERGNRMEQLWQQLQSELATKTSIAAQITAQQSGHHIHLDQPDLVTVAIHQIGQAAQHVNGSQRQRQQLLAGLQDTATRFADSAKIAMTTVDQPVVAMKY